MSWNPEPSPGDTATLGLNDLGPVRPRGIDNEELIEATADADEGERGSQGNHGERRIEQVVSLTGVAPGSGPRFNPATRDASTSLAGARSAPAASPTLG